MEASLMSINKEQKYETICRLVIYDAASQIEATEIVTLREYFLRAEPIS